MMSVTQASRKRARTTQQHNRRAKAQPQPLSAPHAYNPQQITLDAPTAADKMKARLHSAARAALRNMGED
jgi:hypothetical protein